MNGYDAGYQFTQGLIGLLSVLWPIAGPFVILAVIVGLFRWINSISRGQEVDE